MIKNLILSINKNTFFIRFSLVLLVLYLISIFLNLGVSPFNNEEPRRSIIALEMLFNNNFVVTTLFNETFYDHPPLWNIILAASASIFGIDNEFAYRFPSALSLFLTGVIVFFMGKKYFSLKFGILSAFFYLVSADLYFFFATTAEIDIFFSLLVFLTFLSIFYFYEKQKFSYLFLSAYLFTTLGFLTKGVVAYAFVGISLLTFFIYKKQFKKLFHPIHFIAIFLSFGAIFLYFYTYGLYEDIGNYIEGMWGLTEKKSFLDKKNNAFLSHFILFPLNLLGNLFPATLFVVFLFKKDSISKIKKQPYLYFLLLIFLANFVVYLISTGARARYTYMFYPMCITILVYLFTLEKDKPTWMTNIYFYIISGLCLVFCLAGFIVPFIAYLDIIPSLKYWGPIFGVLFLCVFFLQKKTHNYWNKCLWAISMVILVKTIYAIGVFPIKNLKSSSAVFKIQAENILKITKDEPIYVLSTESIRVHKKFPMNFYKTGVYLEMKGHQIVKKVPEIQEKGYYILNTEDLNKQEIVYSFDVGNQKMALIKN